jgi:hypothetical protein
VNLDHRVIATSVVREAIRGKQSTGSVYEIDGGTGEVVRTFAVPEPTHPESDANPRGGSRGGRGAAVTPFGTVLSNYDTLVVYDETWSVAETFSHPLFAGIHEISWDGRALYVTASAVDAVLRVDLPKREVEVAWDAHADPRARSILGIGPRRRPLEDGSVDYRVDSTARVDRCHINNAVRVDSRLVVNCGLVRPRRPWLVRRRDRLAVRLGRELSSRRGASVVMSVADSGDTTELVRLDHHEKPTHNGRMLKSGRILLNDSTTNRIRVFDDGREVTSIPVAGTWLRGMVVLDENRLLVGTAPASIVLIDVEAGAELQRVTLSENRLEALHGLTLAPNGHPA